MKSKRQVVAALTLALLAETWPTSPLMSRLCSPRQASPELL